MKDLNDFPPPAQIFPHVTRIEVIGDGREYTCLDAAEVFICLQDGGRTLKIFKKTMTITCPVCCTALEVKDNEVIDPYGKEPVFWNYAWLCSKCAADIGGYLDD